MLSGTPLEAAQPCHGLPAASSGQRWGDRCWQPCHNGNRWVGDTRRAKCCVRPLGSSLATCQDHPQTQDPPHTLLVQWGWERRWEPPVPWAQLWPLFFYKSPPQPFALMGRVLNMAKGARLDPPKGRARPGTPIRARLGWRHAGDVTPGAQAWLGSRLGLRRGRGQRQSGEEGFIFPSGPPSPTSCPAAPGQGYLGSPRVPLCTAAPAPGLSPVLAAAGEGQRVAAQHQGRGWTQQPLPEAQTKCNRNGHSSWGGRGAELWGGAAGSQPCSPPCPLCASPQDGPWNLARQDIYSRQLESWNGPGLLCSMG